MATFQVDVLIFGRPYVMEFEANSPADAVSKATMSSPTIQAAASGTALVAINPRQSAVPKGH